MPRPVQLGEDESQGVVVCPPGVGHDQTRHNNLSAQRLLSPRGQFSIMPRNCQGKCALQGKNPVVARERGLCTRHLSRAAWDGLERLPHPLRH